MLYMAVKKKKKTPIKVIFYDGGRLKVKWDGGGDSWIWKISGILRLSLFYF